MIHLVQPRLVNEPFSDPGLLLDFRFGRQAILFDLGDLSPLSPREILRVGAVFVSHMHMDHFAGFDRLLRLNLYQNRTVEFTGPEGLADAVEAKLRAYTWNLLGAHSADFALVVREWTPAGFRRACRFAAREAFRRTETEPPRLAEGIVLSESDFAVEATALDHGIPSLAFAFQETRRVNVNRQKLDELGLAVGPWLTQAKSLIRREAPPDTEIVASPARTLRLGALLEAGAFRIGPGQRVAYAVDFGFTRQNVERVVCLTHDADWLFIEAGFLDEDRAIAGEKKHLTALQAGAIARIANARRVTPLHFSARYLGREDELRAELEEGRHGARDPGSPA